MLFRLLKLLLAIFLLSACGKDDDNHTVDIEIYTAGLGVENDNYPQDIIDLWETLTVQGKKVVPNIELKRIDLQEELRLSDLDTGFTLFLQSPEEKLKREKIALGSQKIAINFANSKPSDIDAVMARLSRYPEENIFYLNSKLKGIKSFTKPTDVLQAIATKISQQSNNKQEYIVVYNLIDPKVQYSDSIQNSQQLVDKASFQADEYAKAAKNNLQIAKSGLASVKKASCSNAKKLTVEIEHLAEEVKKAVDETVKFAAAAQVNKQAVGRFLNIATVIQGDNQVIDKAVKDAEMMAKEVEINKIMAEKSAGDAALAVEKIEKSKTSILKLCIKPRKKQYQEDDDTEDTGDPFGGIKKELRKYQESIRRTYQ